MRRIVGREQALALVRQCLAGFEILPIDAPILLRAANLTLIDYEDNIQQAVATDAMLDAIVTRDARGFQRSVIPALTPADLLTRLAASQRIQT